MTPIKNIFTRTKNTNQSRRKNLQI